MVGEEEGSLNELLCIHYIHSFILIHPPTHPQNFMNKKFASIKMERPMDSMKVGWGGGRWVVQYLIQTASFSSIQPTQPTHPPRSV